MKANVPRSLIAWAYNVVATFGTILAAYVLGQRHAQGDSAKEGESLIMLLFFLIVWLHADSWRSSFITSKEHINRLIIEWTL